MIYWSVNRWFAARSDWIATVLVAACAILVVAERGSASSAYAGLALSYMLQVSSSLIEVDLYLSIFYYLIILLFHIVVFIIV